MKKTVKGYKGFNKDLTCRDFQYEFGKDFNYEGEIKLCSTGFHFCKSLGDVYGYYSYDPENTVVCEVESEGEVIDDADGTKSVTNHIRLVRMLNPVEASNNNGKDNTGHSNTGDRNTGHWNTGDSNTGHRNTGHRNTGDSNTGDWNTGDWNTGHRNTGDRNTGDWNTGHRNTGDSNTGDRNTGHWNTGDRNTGHRNTGDSNTGHRNTGDRNTGHWNTGHWNTGHRNTGHWNTGHRNTGYFNILSPEEILVFGKPYSYEKWCEIDKPSCLYFDTKQWISFGDMTSEEKTAFPACKTAGGYIKDIPYKEAFTKSMQNANKEEIKQVKALPNFDKDIFFEISGFMID